MSEIIIAYINYAYNRHCHDGHTAPFDTCPRRTCPETLELLRELLLRAIKIKIMSADQRKFLKEKKL